VKGEPRNIVQAGTGPLLSCKLGKYGAVTPTASTTGWDTPIRPKSKKKELREETSRADWKRATKISSKNLKTGKSLG